MDILKLLTQSGALDQIMDQYGLNEGQVASIIKSSMPEISKAIKNNTQTKDGLEGFMGALKDHEDDDIEKMLKNINNIDTNDGSKILGHIFGQQKEEVNEKIAAKSGVNSSNANALIALLIPIVLSMMGKSAKNRNITRDVPRKSERTSGNTKNNSPVDSLEDILYGKKGNGSVFRENTQNENKSQGSVFDSSNSNNQGNFEGESRGGIMDIVGGLLDMDNDGSVVDDLGSLLKKFL